MLLCIQPCSAFGDTVRFQLSDGLRSLCFLLLPSHPWPTLLFQQTGKQKNKQEVVLLALSSQLACNMTEQLACNQAPLPCSVSRKPMGFCVEQVRLAIGQSYMQFHSTCVFEFAASKSHLLHPSCPCVQTSTVVGVCAVGTTFEMLSLHSTRRLRCDLQRRSSTSVFLGQDFCACPRSIRPAVTQPPNALRMSC